MINLCSKLKLKICWYLTLNAKTKFNKYTKFALKTEKIPIWLRKESGTQLGGWGDGRDGDIESDTSVREQKEVSRWSVEYLG